MIGLVLAAIIAVLGWRARTLSSSGAWAAVVVGGLIFGFGGIAWAVILLTFYLSSSVLSKMFAHRKTEFGSVFSKGGMRDWGQVLANGGLGAALAVVFGASHAYYSWYPDSLFKTGFTPVILIWAAYCGAIAAVTADTWATELGVLSRSDPKLITTGKKVARGTSGAISSLGSLASFGGAALIGFVSALLLGPYLREEQSLWFFFFSIVLGGLSGSVFDSLLGATLQGIYYCPSCQKETERFPRHTCGMRTTPVRGLPWLNNDLVNFFASLVGMVIATGAWILLG